MPYKALTIAVTKRMLYEEKPPLVGVGLVYRPHYVSTVPFSAAYMYLNVWHSAASNEESENRLDAARLLFVDISEMSDVIPVAVQHPILLDLTSQEVVGGTGKPMSPLSFRLHTTWTQTLEGDDSPYFFPSFPRGEQLVSDRIRVGEAPPRPGMSKIAIGLKPPAKDHWNIESDLIFPWILEDSWQRRTATWAAQSQEVRLKGATASQVEAPTSEGSPELQAGSSGKAPPTKMAPDRERVLDYP